MAIGYLIIQARTAHDLRHGRDALHFLHGNKLDGLDGRLSIQDRNAHNMEGMKAVCKCHHIIADIRLSGKIRIQGQGSVQGFQRIPSMTEIQIGMPAVSMTEPRFQEEPDMDSRVLRQVVIPNPITVHLGSPNASARRSRWFRCRTT